MKKRFNIFLLFSLCMGTLLSCGGNTNNKNDVPVIDDNGNDDNNNKDDDQTNNDDDDKDNDSEDEVKEFENIVFEDETCTYDGESHTIEVSNYPDGTEIEYKNNGPFIDVGEYQIEATLKKDGYNCKTFYATLTILKSEFSGISISNKTIYYDGDDHINDIQVVGSIPENTNITYIVYDSSNALVTEAINIGEYTFYATLTNSNFKDLKLSATLKIIQKDTSYPIATEDGNIYFSNGLDDGNLYKYEASSGEIKLYSYITPKGFFNYGDTIAYFSNALFLGGAKSIDGDYILGSGLYQSITSDDSKNLYYSQNFFTNDSSGIYRVDYCDDEEDEAIVTKIYSGKAYDIQYFGGYIYFSSGRDDRKLSRIKANLDSETEEAEIIYDSQYDEGLKIKTLNLYDGALYFNVNNLLGDWIGKYDLKTNTFKKLTSTQGEYLTKIGNYIYFSNNDLITTAVSGHGIFKVSINGGDIEKVIEDEYGINYLAYDETNNSLVYTRTSDLHLIKYSLSSLKSEDLLEDFVIPEETPLNLGGKTVVHNGYIYYLDMYEGKCLARYKDGKKQLLTTNKVEDFSIIGDIVYFNQVNWFNNDLFMFNLKTSEVALRISTDDLNDVVSDGEYLYTSKENVGGYETSGVRLNLDGTNPVEFFSKGITNLRILNDTLYFLEGNELNSIKLESIKELSENTSLESIVYDDAKHIQKFEFYNNKVVYIYEYGLTQALRIGETTNLEDYINLASKNTDPVDFVLDENNGLAYYFTDINFNGENYDGFYKVSLDSVKDGNAESLYLTGGETYFGNSLALDDNNLYFLNRGEGTTGTIYGDSHLYSLSLTNGEEGPIKLA